METTREQTVSTGAFTDPATGIDAVIADIFPED